MLKAAQRSQKRRCTISPRQWNVAQIITVLRGGEPTAAMSYLQGASQHKNGAVVASPAIEEELRVWWRTASQATKRQLINVETADAKKKWAVAKGRRFLAECNLEIWVEDQKVRKGITPMSSLVLQKARNELGLVGIASAKTRKGGFQWLRRWRRRHGVRLRTLPPLDTPSDAVLAQKATVREGGAARG